MLLVRDSDNCQSSGPHLKLLCLVRLSWSFDTEIFVNEINKFQNFLKLLIEIFVNDAGV